MPNVVQSRAQAMPKTAVSAAGQEEPLEPAYWKPVSPSPISSGMRVPSEPTTWKAPVVFRGNRMVGIRHLYARGAVRQPISPLGTGPDLGIAVWTSDFQPDDMGPIRNAGFNDALFQAGYPGFNLGLSFKVMKLPENQTGGPGGGGMKMHSPNIKNRIQRMMSTKGVVSNVG
jgi:hypothetical protein